MKELVLGCGNHRQKVLFHQHLGKEYQNPTYVDIDPDCEPDVLHDLNKHPYPFGDRSFSEIHAYEILEHLGTQGDWKFFFDQFAELHRLLEPDGYVFISVPDGTGKLAWCDPGHTRAFTASTFGFLEQSTYSQVGKTAIADYRHYWKKDFQIIGIDTTDNRLYVVLRKRGN